MRILFRSRGILPGMFLLSALLTATPAGLSGQQSQAGDSIRVEVARLAALVDSLRRSIAEMQDAAQREAAQSELERIRAAAQAATQAAAPTAQQPAGSQEFVGRQRSLQALNPEISVNADIFAHVRPDEPREENFFAREFEISIQSNLDPYSRAKVFIAHHVEGGDISPFEDPTAGADPAEEEGHGGEVAVEEGYVEWVSLPGGVGVKLGRFYQQFGQINRWHAHALPFQTRPLPHLVFMGEEGLAQTGAAFRWLLPTGTGSGTYEASFEVTRSESHTLFGESGRPSLLGHLNAFWQLSPSTDLDLGVSWLNGSYEDEANFFDRNLFGAEFSFTWRPAERARYRGVNIRGGALVLDGLVPSDSPPPAGTVDRALGFWSTAEIRLGQRLLAGARYDRVENPAQPDETAWLVSPTLTWWQSEFVRLRAEYDLLGQMENSRNGRFFFQVTFAMGPHKHESY